MVQKSDVKTLIFWTPTCRRRQSLVTPKTTAWPLAPLGASVGALEPPLAQQVSLGVT